MVFVHGTASSVVRWARDVQPAPVDPEIRSRYQFWFFQYDSGNPIALSALRLREALAAAVRQLDPEGKDPALRRTVLIGHSQGGLLVKMQAIRSDRRFRARPPQAPRRAAASPTRPGPADTPMFVEPPPDVARIVFIATPHRGSFVAGRNFIANLVREAPALPLTLTGAAAQIARNPDAFRGANPVVPSALVQMSPGTTSSEPCRTSWSRRPITVHSIIAVAGDGPFEHGDDGAVANSSARIDRVESQLVVRSEHSTQGHPDTIQEARRILRLHVGLKTTRTRGAQTTITGEEPSMGFARSSGCENGHGDDPNDADRVAPAGRCG